MSTARVLSTKIAAVGTFYFVQAEFQTAQRNGSHTEVRGRLSLGVRGQITKHLNVQACYQLIRQGLVPSLVVALWDERPPKITVAVNYPLQGATAAWEFDNPSGSYQLVVKVGGALVNERMRLESLIMTCLKIVLAATYSCHTHQVVITLSNGVFNQFVADQ